MQTNFALLLMRTTSTSPLRPRNRNAFTLLAQDSVKRSNLLRVSVEADLSSLLIFIEVNIRHQSKAVKNINKMCMTNIISSHVQAQTVAASECGTLKTLVAFDRLPNGWDKNEMVQQSLVGKWREASAAVLVWMIREDERPLYVESAVLWLMLTNPDAKTWMLTHVYRHPKSDPDFRWRVSAVMDAPHVGTTGVLVSPPVVRQVMEFLDRTWWSFEPESDWTVIDAQVCSDAWKTCIGEPPPLSLVQSAEQWRGKRKPEGSEQVVFPGVRARQSFERDISGKNE